MKSLIQRMVVSTAIAIVSLGSASHAMAASPHQRISLHHKAAVSAARAPYRYRAPLDIAAIPPYPNYSSGPAWAPRPRAGYDIEARSPYARWDHRYPVARWADGYPLAAPGFDVGGLIAALLGGAVPPHHGGKVAVSGSGSSDYDYASPPDTSAADAAGWASIQSANDAAASAAAQNDANIQALDQSISAAEAQNDAANAATQQYEINNGM